MNIIKGYFKVTYNWGNMGGFEGRDILIIKAKDIFEANKKYLEWAKEQNKQGVYPSTNEFGFFTIPLYYDID